MAVTVSIEFSDAQWELIKKHYPKEVMEANPGEEAAVPRVATVEDLVTLLKAHVQATVLRYKALEDRLAAANAFEV